MPENQSFFMGIWVHCHFLLLVKICYDVLFLFSKLRVKLFLCITELSDAEIL